MVNAQNIKIINTEIAKLKADVAMLKSSFPPPIVFRGTIKQIKTKDASNADVTAVITSCPGNFATGTITIESDPSSNKCTLIINGITFTAELSKTINTIISSSIKFNNSINVGTITGTYENELYDLVFVITAP